MSSIRIECEICNQLIYAHTIKSHLKTCGQESDCRFCGKKYCTPYYRKLHELSHNKNYVRQRLTCSKCNSNFSAVSSLNNHKKKCLELEEKRKRAKTVALEPFKRVAKVYMPKQHASINEALVADVVHLPDEDIAAVETITSEIEQRNLTPVDDIYENRQKVIIEAVPQFAYVKPKVSNSSK